MSINNSNEYKNIRKQLKTANIFVLRMLMVEIGINEETRDMVICKFVNQLTSVQMERRFYRQIRSVDKKIEQAIKQICNAVKCYKYQPKQIQEYIKLLFDDIDS